MNNVTAIEQGVEASLVDLLNILGRTADAMVAIDAQLRIIAWNEAATKLLGYSSEDALGKPCHEILQWRNRCGDTLCDGSCRSASASARDEIIETCEVLGRSATNRTLWLTASTIVLPPELQHQCRLVHLIREVALSPALEQVIVERLQGWSPDTGQANSRLDVLTPREREVLELLAEGLDGPGIAQRLFVSPATVRNHIQHILAKLEVHSRVEAVALALRGD